MIEYPKNMKKDIQEVSVAFRIYGDNILECEHFVEGLNNTNLSDFKFIKEIGPLDRPILIYEDAKLDGEQYAFQICPYYGGTGQESLWKNNPLNGIFNEKVDVIITKINDDYSESKPVLAIEFCDAIQAGNQSWQRFRRAINAAEAKLPYLYFIPLIGWERASAGLTLKNPRYQSAQVCLAHLSLSSRFGVPSLMIFTPSSWTDYAKEKGYTLPAEYKLLDGHNKGIKLACYFLREAYKKDNYVKENAIKLLKELFKEMFIVAQTYCKFGNTYLPIYYNHTALKSKNIEKAATEYANQIAQNKPVNSKYALHKINFQDFVQFGVPFYKGSQSKTCNKTFIEGILPFINWKKNKDRDYKIKYLKSWGIEVDSSFSSERLNTIFEFHKDKLPITYKEGKSEGFVINNRKHLREIISGVYPKLSKEFLDAIYSKNSSKESMFVVPLYAYKPSGDSRPDRGLLPLLVSLFPNLAKKNNLLVLIYSKYTPINWKLLIENGKNELWNVINELAGFILVDNTKEGTVLFKS